MFAPKKPHVAIFAFPFGTHAAPLLSLSRRLAANAANASFSFFSTPKSNGSLSSIFAASAPLPNLKIYDVSDGVPEGYVPLGKPQEDIELFLKATPGNFKEALETVVKEMGEVTCVLTDSFLWFSGDMAEESGVPWVTFWTSGACSIAAHFYTELFRRKLGTGTDVLATRRDEPLDFVPGFSGLRVCDLPEGIVFGNLDSLFSRLLHRMAEESARATAVAINTFDGLDSTILTDLKSKFRSCLAMGPLSLMSPLPQETDAHACLAWLDRFAHKPASVAYVSFGTVMTPPPAELAALAEGLEESGAPFLWSLREKAREGLPAGFQERTAGRGLFVSWAPQTMVLGHVALGAFVTHCGWNSVLESITAGVPMICRPFFGDQRLNARMVSHVWRIGVEAEGRLLTRDGVVGSMELVLRKDEGRGMRERACALRDMAKEAVGNGGSSVDSFSKLLGIVVSRR
ncbi:anthocyanidin 3-O-glucosyltransferase 7-like [Magnolia sinica]|uniref:anthocyanidin 3-O-glucosyltransferase 7-like n=1 Tax=Magnolia sinica TaxID=86752 RepID=UPI0026596CD3|nr:anthocyanidin 3-O-glucosyltransferase 7-like [Magnolia sinica]